MTTVPPPGGGRLALPRWLVINPGGWAERLLVAGLVQLTGGRDELHASSAARTARPLACTDRHSAFTTTSRKGGARAIVAALPVAGSARPHRPSLTHREVTMGSLDRLFEDPPVLAVPDRTEVYTSKVPGDRDCGHQADWCADQ